MRLKDKAIIVTGSSTGIGEAMARRFVEEGAKVLVHGTNEERARAVTSVLGDAAVHHLDDLIDPEAPERIVQATLDAFGKIDCVVNNAANNVRCNFGEITPEFFDRVIAINLRTPLLLIQAAREELMRTRGAVLNVGSVLAYSGQSNLLTYCVSKGGLMTLSRNLANQLHRKGRPREPCERRLDAHEERARGQGERRHAPRLARDPARPVRALRKPPHARGNRRRRRLLAERREPPHHRKRSRARAIPGHRPHPRSGGGLTGVSPLIALNSTISRGKVASIEIGSVDPRLPHAPKAMGTCPRCNWLVHGDLVHSLSYSVLSSSQAKIIDNIP